MGSPVEKVDDSGFPVNNTPSHLKSTRPSSQNQEKLELLSDSEHHSSNLRPWRIDDDMSFWQTYITEAEKFDKEMVDGWNRSLDNLLVFSGLFSGVNTAFIIETYKLLQQDPAEETARMFRLLLKHRNDDHQFSDEELGLTFGGAERPAIRINSIFFASLSCSLLVALGAVQGKDWLTHYDHHGLASKPHSAQARNRQKKLDGLKRWKFRLLISFLPLLMQISLALFLGGVIVFLWEISSDVAAVVMGFALAGFFGYLVSLFIAVRHPSSPFQTPLSLYLHKPVNMFLNILRLIMNPRNDSTGKITMLGKLWRRIDFSPVAQATDIIGHHVSKCLVWVKKKIEPIDNSGELGMEHNMTSAGCVGWLFEQAEQPEVVLRTLSVASLLPPHHVLEAFNGRPGLLERLATLYSSYVEQRVGKQRSIPNPKETVITSIALFHILKPHLRPNSAKVELALPKHRIRSHKDYINDALAVNDKDLFKVFAIVICCIEMILPDSEGADPSAFKECYEYISEPQTFGPVTLSIPAPNIPNTSLTHLNLTVFPSGLLLDAVIASAVRHIRDDSWRADWYLYYEIPDLLKTLNDLLSKDPLEETISHIAIVMTAVQLARRRPRPDQDTREKNLSEILEAWYIVDKRATVFTNIMLAFAMAGQIQLEDNDTQQIYLALLRFLDDYLPKDMEVSKKTEWTTWWPKAMRLYPGVLGFLSQIDEKKIPLNDVLRVFARLLPDDWQYDYIREALLSQHTKETYPQVHALCPVIDNASPSAADSQATVIGLIIRSFKHRTGDIMAPPPIVQDSVVELLGWFVAYSGANDYLPAQVEAYEEYKYIPQFLVSVIKEKEDGPQPNIVSVGERNDMICRHAARHLLALAYMDAQKGTRASEVKLKSLIHVFQLWRSISHWTRESTSKIHPGRNFEGGLIIQLVAIPFQHRRQVESVREGSVHHIRDPAFKEMMKVWKMAAGDVDSLERQLLLKEHAEPVHYFEQRLDQQDLASWESGVIDTAIDYMQTTKQDINPDRRRRLDDLVRDNQRRRSLLGWPKLTLPDV
ncbi:hypothetical protein FRC03_000725 [Tulasnella sp. 419]|nr:hypothetical protein FRC03_000725 [Tulasnella sp. 419]